jgi:hypothetical protein
MCFIEDESCEHPPQQDFYMSGILEAQKTRGARLSRLALSSHVPTREWECGMEMRIWGEGKFCGGTLHLCEIGCGTLEYFFFVVGH